MTRLYCDVCQHHQGNHEMISFTGELRDGGIMLCPEPGCQCYTTWSLGKNSSPPIGLPGPEEIQELRDQLQGKDT